MVHGYHLGTHFLGKNLSEQEKQFITQGQNAYCFYFSIN